MSSRPSPTLITILRSALAFANAAKARARKPRPGYLVVLHAANGPRVVHIASKTIAHRVGSSMRRRGANVSVYSREAAARFGLAREVQP